MIIKVERRMTVKEFMEDVLKKYGSLNKLEQYVRSHPEDADAMLDLDDYKY